MKKWHTQTCKLGWTVKSIWGKGSTSDDINSVDRSKKKVILLLRVAPSDRWLG